MPRSTELMSERPQNAIVRSNSLWMISRASLGGWLIGTAPAAGYLMKTKHGRDMMNRKRKVGRSLNVADK